MQSARMAFGGLMVALGLGSAPGCDTSPKSDSDFPPPVSLLDAIAIAEAGFPSGTAVEADLEFAEPPARYEIDLLDGDEVREVLVDPQNGKIVDDAIDLEGLEDIRAGFAALTASPVTLASAIAAAEDAAKGTAVSVDIESPEVMAVIVLRADTTLLVSIGLADGTVLSVDGAPAEDDT